MSDWNKGTKRDDLIAACEDREIGFGDNATRGDLLTLLEEHDAEPAQDPEDELDPDLDGDLEEDEGEENEDPEARPRARSEASAPKPVDAHTVAAPTKETRDRGSTRQPRRPHEAELPLSDKTVQVPKPYERPAPPTQFRVGARVVITDWGKRHGEIIEIQGDLLHLKLDGAVLDPSNPKRMVDKVEVEKSRCRLCAPKAA